MPAFEKALYRVQQGRCFNCGKQLAALRKNGTLPASVNREHVTPRALGGAKGYPNLALSHIDCNRIKDDQPPTPDQLARLDAINRALTREEIVAGAAEEVELLHNPRMVDRLPGAGRLRSRAVEFLASTLPHLSRDEMIAAFVNGGAYGQSAPPAAPPAGAQAAAPAIQPAAAPPPQPRHAFAPDPLDLPSEAEPPTVARPRLLLAGLGITGLAASLATAAPMLGMLRQVGLVAPAWIAPALLAASIAVVVLGRGGMRGPGVILLVSAVVAALGVTALDPQARALFNDMMAGNAIHFRLPVHVSPLALGGLALSAFAWLMVTIGGLTARAPLSEAN